MKPHERLFVAMGFLTMLVIGATMPTDPDIDNAPTWIDRVFVGALIVGCAIWALRALRDMSHRHPRSAPPKERYHYYDSRRRNRK